VPEIDLFARLLLEEAKRFLEKAKESEDDIARDANAHASLLLAFCALEAHVNAASNDFAGRPDLSAHDRAILFEQEVRLENGEFVLRPDHLKIFRLEDRLLFLYQKISGKAADRTSPWWAALGHALDLRNRLTHPKNVPKISTTLAETAIQAVIDTIDALYRAIYNEKFPQPLEDCSPCWIFSVIGFQPIDDV
jgi:hypothetical protein